MPQFSIRLDFDNRAIAVRAIPRFQWPWRQAAEIHGIVIAHHNRASRIILSRDSIVTAAIVTRM